MSPSAPVNYRGVSQFPETTHPSPPLSQQIATWVLMIPLFFFACRGILWFQASEGNTVGSAGFSATLASKGAATAEILVAVFLCVIAVISTQLVPIAALCWKHKAFALLGIYAVASSLWSQQPGLSLQFGIYALLDILFAFYLIARFRLERLMQLFALTGSVIILSSIFFAVALPQYGVDHRAINAGAWQGVFLYKNTCSIMVAFLTAVIFFIRMGGWRGQLLRATYFVLAFFLILMTQARTGWVVLASLLVYVAGLNLIERFRPGDRLPISVTLFVVVLAAASISAIYYTELMQFLGKDPTLTGRTGIWKLVVASALKRPWLGYGYRAFWTGAQGESGNITLMEGWTVPGAHNGFLEVWLDLGLVGLAMAGFTLLRALRDAYFCFQAGASRSAKWYLSILIMTFVTNIAEMTVMFPNYLTWIMYVIACVGLAQQAGNVRTAAQE